MRFWRSYLRFGDKQLTINKLNKFWEFKLLTFRDPKKWYESFLWDFDDSY